MQLETQVFGPSETVRSESDINSIAWDGRRLAIRVAQVASGQPARVQGLDIEFPDVRAFRVLDESDLARYWISPGFVGESHVLKVLEGGWRDEEKVHQPLQSGPEWLVITGNACVSVLASAVPTITPASWDW